MQPGRVEFKNGELTIVANNSDLRELLKSLSATSGMTVDGLPPASLISGIYGPGKPREVLTQLLEGSQCNYVLVGANDEGMPRRLLLSSRSTTPSPPAGSAQRGSGVPRTTLGISPSAPDNAAAKVQERSSGTETSPDSSDPASSEPLGPGAITHVPPSETGDAVSAENAGARMQQHLQKLQQLQQQQGAPE